MRRFTLYNYRKIGAQCILLAVGLVLFWKWINRVPTPPDPLTISQASAMEFFEDRLKGDGLHFTWAHAVNSQRELESAVKAGVCGIEADVVLKNEGTSKQELLPIMAHPPILRSDLTLRTFLHRTILGQSVIKLDFKSMSAVELSLQIVNELSEQIKVPVWLNADILQGPGNSPAANVPASSFLMKVSSGFSYCTLSLGWTTSFHRPQPYSWSNVYEMYTVLRPKIAPGQSITFPINASLLKNSVIPLKWLCEQFDASLTLWQSVPEAPVEISELVYLRSKFPKSNLYYDLQADTMSQFIKVADDNSSLTEAHRTRELNSYVTKDWVIKVSNMQTSDLKLGADVVWLSGPGAQITSKVAVRLEQQLIIKGAVSFISMTGSGSYKSNLQIFVYGVDHLNNHPSGVRCSVDNTGRMVVAADRLRGSKLYIDEEVGVSLTSCYQFVLKISRYDLEFSASAPKFDCNVMQDLVRPKTIKTVVDSEGLTIPYHVTIRNSRSHGYAIIEQLNLDAK